MHGLLYDFLGNTSVVELSIPDESLFTQSPLWVLFNHCLSYLLENKTIKLTTAGYFPPKLVKELYALGCIEDSLIDAGISKLNKESDVRFFEVLRILLVKSPYVKKQHNTLSLTQKFRKSTPAECFGWLMEEFLLRYNWSYLDGYESRGFGQFGAGFILYLMKIHRIEIHQVKFYFDQYIQAFPMLLEDFEEREYRSQIGSARNCLQCRVFERVFVQLGIIEKRVTDTPKNKFIDVFEFNHTQLFDALFEFDEDLLS